MRNLALIQLPLSIRPEVDNCQRKACTVLVKFSIAVFQENLLCNVLCHLKTSSNNVSNVMD